MYTGIIKHIGEIENIIKKEGLHSFTIKTPASFLKTAEIGASISVDGVCLTVTELNGDSFCADAMEETLNKTTLSSLEKDSKVHLERSAKANSEVGGHILSGHIDTTAKVIEVIKTENNFVLKFKVQDEFRKYIFNKGYIAINGASLTVSNYDREKGEFSVWLIPETLRQTNFSLLKFNSEVNLEIERQTQTIVDTIFYTLKELHT